MREFFMYFLERKDQVISLLLQHLGLTIASVIVAILVGVPLGILITRKKSLSGPIVGLANLVQAIPSLALLGFLIPVLGIGSTPAIVMVFLYSLLPILKNTYTGLKNINPDMLEAAEGMGLTSRQKLQMVQLPLALPVIMAGIRIAAVTAVGLMTIAAFIGAGGLGYMVFTGVQRVDNFMILSGAIPACILALLMDFIIGKIENEVVPEGIKLNKEGKRRKVKRRTRQNERRNRAIAITAAAAIVISIIGGIGYKAYSNNKEFVVGSKNFTEQIILGNMFATLVEENTDLNVKRTGLNLGGSSVAWEALKSGDIDMYVEYTGTGLVNIMQQSVVSNPKEAYDIVKEHFNKEYDITWLDTLGFNNTYVLAVRQDTAKQYNLKKISDLKIGEKNFIFGPTMEFTDREDGYLGMQDIYHIKFDTVKPVDGGLRYTAISNKESDVIDAFATDGLLKAYNLVTLEDDKNIFPPYNAAPIVRNDTLKKYPELKELLNKLSGQIDDETMRELNYKVDKLGEDPRTVADEFLKEKGLI
ncbi:ABC transporter permease subunit [Clostridium bovifaecis]|uniref:ABC transporter permease subunit n=1 Tax=Clostridium bovifaecis TaxID=2184719 RepID=A0A6I6EK07_9CLOT|nr:ABC transporter permease subunit [Clostridium bovifaecis]